MTPPRVNGVLRYKVEELERDVEKLDSKLDRFVMAAIAAIFTFSVAILLLSINLLVLRRG